MTARFRSIVALVAVVGTALFAASAQPDTAQREKKAEHTLVNKAKDIYVLSERDEPILDYFQRQRIIVGGVFRKGLTGAKTGLDNLLEAKEQVPMFFLSYSSQNDDASKASLFGAAITIAPPTPAVVKLLKDAKPDNEETANLSMTIILRRDDKTATLYHLIGYSKRGTVGFFDNAKKHEVDGFSQKDLCYKPPAPK